MRTKIEIFKASGFHEINVMQDAVNDWLQSAGVEIISITPAMCSIGAAGEETYQFMTITVAYREKS